jgi:hypothetical protein
MKGQKFCKLFDQEDGGQMLVLNPANAAKKPVVVFMSVIKTGGIEEGVMDFMSQSLANAFFENEMDEKFVSSVYNDMKRNLADDADASNTDLGATQGQ